MATTIDPSTGGAAPDALDQRVVLDDLGWKGYLALLRLRGDPSSPRMIYLDGSVHFMSPPLPHEHLKERVGRFVGEVVVALQIPCKPIGLQGIGQATLRSRTRRGGVEGDQVYYLAYEAGVRGKTRIDLRTDPPPDLAVEVVHTHGADAALEVYRRLCVPEVWICTEAEVSILVRQADGRYAAAESRAFPFLTAAEVASWLRRSETVSETEWLGELRSRVRDVSAPCARRGGGA